MKKQNSSLSKFKTKKVATSSIDRLVGGQERKAKEAPTNG